MGELEGLNFNRMEANGKFEGETDKLEGIDKK